MFSGNYHTPHATSTNSETIKRFWDRFINISVKQGVGESYLRWYVIRAEQYLKANPGKKLAQHSADDVNAYLKNLGRNETLKDWQFRQTVDAIRNLFLTAGVDRVEGVDWNYWQDSAKTLTVNHATLAREPLPEHPDHVPVSGKNFKKKDQKD